MNYKLNVLKKKVKCSERPFSEIPISVGTVGDGQSVFDIDQYCEEAGVEVEDWKIFTQRHRLYIERYAARAEKKTSELFYQNTDGHILMDLSLVFIYLIYKDDDLSAYLFSLLTDVLSDGVCFSDTYVVELAAERLPEEVVRRMFGKVKQEDEDESEEQ